MKNRPPETTNTEKAKSVLRGKTAQAVLWFLVLCAIAKFNDDPRELLAHLNFTPSQGVSIISTSATGDDQSHDDGESPPETPYEQKLAEIAQSMGINLHAADLTGKARQVEDPTGLAMRSFYEALLRTTRDEEGAITRILHYGDSLVVVDFVTGQIRRRLQTRFGDAGHGYMLAGKPWRWYQHWDVTYRTAKSWIIRGIMKRASGTGQYGLGGYNFDGNGAAQFLEMGTKKNGLVGKKASRFEVHYLIQPGGGSFDVFIDGKLHSRVSTKGPSYRSGVKVVQVADGPHKFRAQCAGDGKVSLFGGVLERNKPGIVYDTLGINGARARTLDRIEPAFWAEQLRLRKPNLVIVNFGTNESEDEGRPMKVVEADYLSVLQRLRAAVPEASCLVMAPMDRAARVNGVLTSKPILPRLVEAQRRAALKGGCAFYDTYQAMGGKGAMAKWYRARPRLCAGDFTHPTRTGANLLGDGLYRSLVRGMIMYQTQIMLASQHGFSSFSAGSGTILYDPLHPAEPDPYPPMPEPPRIPY